MAQKGRRRRRFVLRVAYTQNSVLSAIVFCSEIRALFSIVAPGALRMAVRSDTGGLSGDVAGPARWRRGGAVDSLESLRVRSKDNGSLESRPSLSFWIALSPCISAKKVRRVPHPSVYRAFTRECPDHTPEYIPDTVDCRGPAPERLANTPAHPYPTVSGRTPTPECLRHTLECSANSLKCSSPTPQCLSDSPECSGHTPAYPWDPSECVGCQRKCLEGAVEFLHHDRFRRSGPADISDF